MVENMCGLGDTPIEIANEALQPHGLCLRPGQGGWRQRLCPSPMAGEEIQEQQQQLCDVGSHSASQTRQVKTTLRRNPQVRLWSEDQRNRVETRTVRRLDACPGFCCGKAEKQAQGVKESMDEEEELKRRPRATGKWGYD